MFTNLFSLTADPAKNSTASGLTQYLPTAETMSTVVGAALGEEDWLSGHHELAQGIALHRVADTASL